MIIDLSSPIEMRGYELLHDDAGTARAYIDLFNVSDDTVVSYTATARWANDASGCSANDYVCVDAIAIPGGGKFKLSLSTSAVKFADRLELYFSGVRFENGESWAPKDGELVDVGETLPLQGQELDILKQSAGEDALMYPETQDEFWRCVCGRINPLGSDVCARCRRERNYVLGELNRKAVNLDKEQKKSRQRRRQRAVRASGKAADARYRSELYTILMLASMLIFLAASALVLTFY